MFVFFLMIRRPPRSTLDRSSAASDVYKRQVRGFAGAMRSAAAIRKVAGGGDLIEKRIKVKVQDLSLIHISEPTRPY